MQHPSGIVVAHMAQMRSHFQDEVVALAVFGFAAEHLLQFIYKIGVGNAAIELRISLDRKRRGSFWGNHYICARRSPIEAQSALLIGLAPQGNLLFRQFRLPLVRTIDDRILVHHINHALRREAVLVGLHTQCLAIGALSLLDGLSHGDADVKMELVRGRPLHAKQHSLPRPLLLVQLACFGHSWLHLLLLVDIHAGLKGESLGHK